MDTPKKKKKKCINQFSYTDLWDTDTPLLWTMDK